MKRKYRFVQYFVEGECERKLINDLKAPPYNYIIPGKVDVFNVISSRLTKQRILSLKRNTLIIFVYDTDVRKTDILEENIKILNDNGFLDIVHIQSILNLEDEIIFSSNLKSIHQIFNTQNNNKFKSKFIESYDIVSKLQKFDFKKELLWTRITKDEAFIKYIENNIFNIKEE